MVTVNKIQKTAVHTQCIHSNTGHRPVRFIQIKHIGEIFCPGDLQLQAAADHPETVIANRGFRRNHDFFTVSLICKIYIIYHALYAFTNFSHANSSRKLSKVPFSSAVRIREARLR